MLKKILRVIIVATFMSTTLVMIGCSVKTDNHEYQFNGIQDISITISDSNYDFKSGVTALCDMVEADFTVDTSKVKFGEAGKYEVTYKIGNKTQSSYVYIYGKPQFTICSSEVNYGEALTTMGLKNLVEVKDTFGEKLSPNVVSGIEENEFGYVEYGTYKVKYYAIDKLNNSVEFEIDVKVVDSGKLKVDDFAIDYSDIESSSISLGEKVLRKIVFDGELLTEDDFIFTFGYLRFSTEFVCAQELGEHEIILVTDDGYSTSKVIIKDDQPAVFNYEIADMEYANTLTINKLKYEGFQKVTFSYELKDSRNNVVELTEAEDTLSFVPGLEQNFTLTIKASRNDVSAGQKSYSFNVKDNVYAWATENVNNEKGIYFEAQESKYSREITHGDDSTSLYIGNQTGIIQLFLDNNIKNLRKIVFYVYNTTGIELGSYVITDNGYWTQTISNGIISESVTISSEETWQKVELNFVPAFTDKHLGSITSGEDEMASKTHIRIFNPDAWKWEGEDLFGIYISDLYYETIHTEEEITYNTATLMSKGIKNSPVKLGSASALDNRFRFEYSVSDGEKDIEINQIDNVFIPETVGNYTYKITSYYRDELVAEKNYTIVVEDKITCDIKDYYRYDDAGKIVLPKAVVGDDQVVCVYTVEDVDGTITTLTDNMIFNCGKVSGEYTFKIVATLGDSEYGTIEKIIAIHPDKVYYDFGEMGEDIKESIKVIPDTIITRDTTEHVVGELASLKMDNTNFNEKANFQIQLGDNASNCELIRLKVKFVSDEPMYAAIYSASTWQYSSYTIDGNHYTDWSAHILGDGEWHEVEIFLFNTIGTRVSGDDIRVMFQASGYSYTGAQPILYISNVYYQPIQE